MCADSRATHALHITHSTHHTHHTHTHTNRNWTLLLFRFSVALVIYWTSPPPSVTRYFVVIRNYLKVSLFFSRPCVFSQSPNVVPAQALPGRPPRNMMSEDQLRNWVYNTHCSALIKVTGDLSDIFAGAHRTFHSIHPHFHTRARAYLWCVSCVVCRVCVV
jgi:hypothetical protein